MKINNEKELEEAIRLIDGIRQIHSCFSREKNDLIGDIEKFYRIVDAEYKVYKQALENLDKE